MADRPILFSAPMVRALLAGTKTQTRRASKWQPWPCGGKIPGAIYSNDYYWPISGGFGTVSNKPYPPESWLKVHGPRYAVGDRLYVREHWRTADAYDDLAPSQMGGEEPIIYLADDTLETWGWGNRFVPGRCRQGMHMPRWASRITLLVTEVRVERLQEITRGDAMAEGCPFANMALGPDPREWFRDLWDQINGPGAWVENPWVAAYSFTVVCGNIDQIGKATDA